MPTTPRTAIRTRTYQAARGASFGHLLRGRTLAVLVPVLVAVLIPGDMGAQTRSTSVLSVDFSRSAAQSNVARAPHPSDCVVIIQRVRDSSLVGKGVDTLLTADADTLPTFVVQMARQCLRKFPIATITAVDVPVMQPILVLSEAPDADFDALLARHLALLPPKSPRERITLFNGYAGLAAGLRPKRVSLVRHFLAMGEAMGDEVLYEKMTFHGKVEGLLYPDNIDTLLKVKHEQYAMAQRIDQLRKTPNYSTNMAVTSDWMWQGELELYGNDGWLQYLKTGADTDLARYLEGLRKQFGPSMNGEPLPPLTAEFWFSNDPKAPPMTQPPAFPVPGALGLVVVIDSKIDKATAKYYQRFHKKYPQITLVFLTATKGFYRHRALPMTAAQEAEAVHDYWANFLQMPGYLGIGVDTYLKLADGRHFPRVTQNELNFGTGRIDPFQIAAQTILVNHQGRVISKNEIIKPFELDRLLEIAQQAKKP